MHPPPPPAPHPRLARKTPPRPHPHRHHPRRPHPPKPAPRSAATTTTPRMTRRRGAMTRGLAATRDCRGGRAGSWLTNRCDADMSTSQTTSAAHQSEQQLEITAPRGHVPARCACTFGDTPAPLGVQPEPSIRRARGKQQRWERGLPRRAAQPAVGAWQSRRRAFWDADGDAALRPDRCGIGRGRDRSRGGRGDACRRLDSATLQPSSRPAGGSSLLSSTKGCSSCRLVVGAIVAAG